MLCLQTWHRFSARSSKYSPEEADNKWSQLLETAHQTGGYDGRLLVLLGKTRLANLISGMLLSVADALPSAMFQVFL